MATVIIDVNLTSDDARKRAEELGRSIDQLRVKQVLLAADNKKGTVEYIENANAIRQLTAEQKQYITLTNAQVGSNNQLRAQLAILTAQYNSLSKAERENTLTGKALQTQIRGISDELKVNEGIVGDTRRNVGNYRDQFKELGKDFVAQIPIVGQYSQQLGSLTGIIKANITGLNLFKVALASTGIGAIIVLLGSLIAYFQSTEEGAEKLERGVASLKGAFMAFIAPLADVGRFLVNLFTEPQQALKDFRALLSGNLLTGLKNFGKSVKDGFNAGGAIKQLEQDAEDAGRELNRQASKLRADAALLRAKGDADSLRQAEAFYKKADALTQQAVGAEINAQQALIKQREKNGQARDADYDKLNELYAKQDQSRQKDAAKAEKINARLEKMRQKQQADAEKAAQKQLEADTALIESETRVTNIRVDARRQEINAINADIDAKVLKYKEYGKTTEALERERIARLNEVDRQWRNQQLKDYIAFAEQIEAETNKSIDLQIAGIKDLNQRAYAELVVGQERELAALDKQIEQTAFKLMAGDVKQNALLPELLKRRNELIKKNLEDRNQITLEANLQRSVDAAQLAFDTAQTPEQELAARQEFLIAKTQLDLEAAQGNAAAIAEINARSAYEQDQLDEDILANKISRIQQFGAVFQEVVGKNTLAAKIAGEISARIDSAQSLRNSVLIVQEQIKAIVSQGKLVFPLNIGAIFATLAAITSGIAAAKNLISIPKGFDKGGVFESDGRGAILPGYSRHDDTNARLRKGEAVIVSEATRDPDALAALSAINTAFGGRPLAPGYAMAQGGLAYGGYVTNMNDQANAQVDMQNAIVRGFMLAPAPVVGVKQIITETQKYNQAVVNGVI